MLFQARITISVTSRGGGVPVSVLWLLAGCRLGQTHLQATEAWEVFFFFFARGNADPSEDRALFCRLLGRVSHADPWERYAGWAANTSHHPAG